MNRAALITLSGLLVPSWARTSGPSIMVIHRLRQDRGRIHRPRQRLSGSDRNIATSLLRVARATDASFSMSPSLTTKSAAKEQ